MNKDEKKLLLYRTTLVCIARVFKGLSEEMMFGADNFPVGVTTAEKESILKFIIDSKRMDQSAEKVLDEIDGAMEEENGKE